MAVNDQESFYRRSDAELVQAIRAGDRLAEFELNRRWTPRLVGLARSILHDDELAEDAAQLALWRAYLNLGRYDASRPFEPWILRIVHNVAFDILRRRRTQPVADGGEVLDESADGGTPVPEQAAASEAFVALHECEEGLAERSREVVALFKTGLSLNKIGLALGSPKTTVQSWLDKALEQLRRCMEGKGFG